MKLTTYGPITLQDVIFINYVNPVLDIYEDAMYYYQYHKPTGYYRMAAKHQLYQPSLFGPWLNVATTDIIFP